jgi:hypothetical protein
MNNVTALAEALEAVLASAAAWVAALDALVAARQFSEEVHAEQEAVDLAGSRLVAAVNQWQSCRESGLSMAGTGNRLQTSDAIAEFIARGGTVTLCPTACVADGTAAPPSADRKRLSEHHLRRAAALTLRWGPQRERLRPGGKPAPGGRPTGGAN